MTADDTGRTRAYAVRQVNPFEGVLQIIETHNARAYSPNGRVWQIQVIAQRPDHTWRSFSHSEPIEQFFNFGLWDAEYGLHKIPANPVMDIGSMRDAAEQITAEIGKLEDRLPFPLVDNYECWATDDCGAPIALLATAEAPATIRDMRVEHWHATRLPDHSFVSKSLLNRGTPATGDMGSRQHAAHLERMVRQTGQQQAWFKRLANGRGEPMDKKSAEMREAAEFPPLGLKTDWKVPREHELVDDYLRWLSPRLLMLQNIDDERRRGLERSACARATELAAVYRLIPIIMDRQAIEAARVEARLRRTSR